MIKAEFKSYESYTTDSVSQWDLNQKLTISGLDIDVAPVLAFSCFGMSESIIVQSKLSDGVITCDVPNAILQFGKNLNVDLCSKNGGQYKAFEKIIIPVSRRKKPSDYLFTDNVPLSTYESIRADLEEDINSNKTYMDKVKTELKNDNKTLEERINNIITGSTSTIKFKTIKSNSVKFEKPGSNKYYETFVIRSSTSSDLKSIMDKSPKVVEAVIIPEKLKENPPDEVTNTDIDHAQFNVSCQYHSYTENGELIIHIPTTIEYYGLVSGGFKDVTLHAEVTIAYEDTETDTSSAELKDIRIGANGTTYPTAGDAVRGQFNELKKELDDSNLDENISQIQKNKEKISQLKESLGN